MNGAKLRLLGAAGLFAAWVGWLGYLAVSTAGEPVLSRPQFLVASLCVLAELKGDDHPDAEVVVRQVLWSADKQDREREGQRLSIANLPKCGTDRGWRGPGNYLLPLTRLRDAKGLSFLVTATPRSPGYPSDGAFKPGSTTIYRDTVQTRAQADKIRERFGKGLQGN